ncbi:MAG TPA: PAS domain S-box protein [Bacteroidales bacterium]|nr:PAS domain S-box protein [Bacteroidales bacterium]
MPKHGQLSEENYRDLVESSGSIIMKADKNLNITYMNDFGLEFFGYTREEILGRNVLGTTIPKRDHAGRDLEAMTEEIKNNPHLYLTNVHQNTRKSGELVWVSWTNKPRYDKGGKLIEILAIGNDISKLVRAEESLRESRDAAELLIKSAPTGIYEVDYRTPKLLSVNDFICEITGYSREELLSIHPSRLLDERSNLIFRDRIKNILSGQKIADNVEYKIIGKDGRELWADLNIKVFSEKEGSPVALVIAHDITERKKAEEALRESEERYRLLHESLRDAFVLVDLNGKIIQFNEIYREMLGYTAGELYNLTYTDLTPAKWHAAEEKIVKEQILPLGYSDIYEKEYITKDGKVIPVELRTVLSRDAEGRPKGMWAIVRDITDRRKAEQALRESERKFRDMFDSAPINMALVRLDGSLIDVNDAAVKMHGFSSKEELLVNSSFDLVDKAYHQKVAEGFAKALEAGHVHDIELIQLKKDGEKIYTLASATVMKDIQGNPYAFLAMVKDITERKKLEYELTTYSETLEERVRLRSEQVMAERKRLLDVLETLPVRICLLTQDHKVVFANRSFRDAFGDSKGVLCHEWCYNKKEPCEFCETFRVLNTGKPHHWEVNTPGGEIIDVNDFPFKDIDGSPLILKMNIDITVQKNAEEKLRKSREHLEKLNAELVRSNRELEHFAYIASHDLQEPLRMITSFTQLLTLKYEDKFDDEAKEYFGYVVDGGKRMYELINGLLAYSRISRQRITYSEVDLNSIIDIVKSNLALIIKERSCSIDCERLPRVNASHEQMIQLFQNLISNSIKFSQQTPRIHISARTEKKRYIFSVKDEGIGIERQYFEKIFQIFKRLMPRDKYEGTGIGLAICKRIIENHHGEIWVESEPGKGSVFHFTIPR